MTPPYEHLTPHEDPTDWEKHQRRSKAQTLLLSALLALIAAVGSAVFVMGLEILQRVSAVETIAAPMERVSALEADIDSIESRQSRMESRQLRLEDRHAEALDEIREQLREINSKLSDKADRK